MYTSRRLLSADSSLWAPGPSLPETASDADKARMFDSYSEADAGAGRCRGNKVNSTTPSIALK